MKVKTTTPAPATPAVEVESPTVDKAAEISIILPGVKGVFDAAGNLEGAKVKVCSLLIERAEILGDSLDKPTGRDIIANAIAQAKGVKLGRVNTKPEKGEDGKWKLSAGDPTLYSLLSEISTIVFGTEHREKVKSEIAKGTSFDKLRMFARHGKPFAPKRLAKEPAAFTADLLLTAAISLVMKARLNSIEYQIITDTFTTAVESCEKEETNPTK